MSNEAQLSLSGYVATDPRPSNPGTNRSRTNMRVAWTPRWIDRSTGEWADGQTSFINVVCWRKLADNVATCVHKGDPVTVKGRLNIRSYEDKEGVSKQTVECDAFSVGHDLSRGVAVFQRTRSGAGLTPLGQLTAGPASTAPPGDDQPGGGPFGAGDPDGKAPAGGPASGDSIFDEGAIAALAPDADSVPVPF
jgi:single-strand DNA-binding protein